MIQPRRRFALTATTAALLSVAVFARQSPPTTPTTRPAASGDWFSAAQQPTTQNGSETDAQIFARLYPELAKMDNATRAVTPRVLFDAMGSRGKPQTKLSPMWGIYETFTDVSIRDHRASKPLNPWLLVPDERRIRIGAVSARKSAASLFLDVEELPLDPRVSPMEDVDRSIRVIAKMVGWVRAQDPNLRLFFYDAFPVGEAYVGPTRLRSATTKPTGKDYAWWKDSTAKFEAQRDQWRAANDRMATLASFFDACCPSLYLHPGEVLTDTGTGIPGLVRENVNEARRYGKPVYPFVWYLIWNTTEPVPLKQWTTLMREVMTWADGAILWDGQTTWNNRLALRVRIAMIVAERKGEITDAEIYELTKADYPGDTELLVLRGDAAATRPAAGAGSPQPTQQTR